ncbi:MAG: hypothetical protein LAN63_11085 [Acidobacteriia bacterium]|nr:hypothetical protein [Terriglobia bacterium]
MNPLREAMAMVWSSKRLWLLQFLLNPVLLALGVWWLTIPEAHIWQLGLSVVLAFVVVVGMLWLQAGTLVYFAGEQTPGAAFGSVRRKLVAFATWVLAMAVCLCLVESWSAKAYQYASYLRSVLPLALRRHVSESQMDSSVNLLFWALFWIIVPGLLLPLGLQMAKRGFRGLGNGGWRAWARTVASREYWPAVIVLALVGVSLPQEFIGWVPKMSSVSGQAASMVLRFLAAWLLAVTAWVVLTSVVGRFGRDSSQVGGESAS